MDWDDIRYFLVLARTGSLSAAARVLRGYARYGGSAYHSSRN